MPFLDCASLHQGSARLFTPHRCGQRTYAFAIRQWRIDKASEPRTSFLMFDQVRAGGEWENTVLTNAGRRRYNLSTLSTSPTFSASLTFTAAAASVGMISSTSSAT